MHGSAVCGLFACMQGCTRTGAIVSSVVVHASNLEHSNVMTTAYSAWSAVPFGTRPFDLSPAMLQLVLTMAAANN